MKRRLIHRFRYNRRTLGRFRRMSLILICCVGLVGWMLFRCRPILLAFAESQAVWTATKIANQMAAQVLTDYAEECEETITVTYDGQNKVSAIQTDVSFINVVRTELTERSITAMEQFSALSVSLPMGTLTGWDWFSGLGPLVTFPISFTATMISDVSSSLVAKGINQSSYRVLVHLEISLYVVTPAGRTTVGVHVSYPMAEAVILGEVPDNLTEVYGDDQSLLGQIFDYGTIQ